MRLMVGLAQMYPKIGDVQVNLEKHLALVEQAAAAGTDLLVFPEMSMTGYQVQDLVPEVAIEAHDRDPVYGRLLAASERIDLVVGFVQRDSRQRYFVAQAYLSGGHTVHVHHKVYLPTYGMFDEARYFDQGEHVRAFDTRFGRVGMLICEDFWHMSPPYLLWMDGADLLIFSSSSPGRGLSGEERLSDSRWVEQVNQAYGSAFTNYVIHVNRVGYEDGKAFWGGSSIVDPNGNFLVRGHYFDEMLITHQIDLNAVRRTRARLPLLRDERPALVQRELARILAKDEHTL
ncbi:MAG: nitrilase-related carbon-nitrogen hydrolase [bacterium]|nr:nitrilase-related carbon-nitrogen hydrolase [bacterium]